MTRAEREQQIARYLRGDMTPAEEEGFFIQVALDGELRTELKAHRILDDSMENYRRSEMRPHTMLRERTAAMLAAYPAPEPVAPPQGWLARTADMTRSVLHQQTRWLITGIAAIGIAAGALLLYPTFTDRTSAETPRRSDTPTTLQHDPAPTLRQSNGQDRPPATEPDLSRSESSAPSQSTENRATRRSEPAEVTRPEPEQATARQQSLQREQRHPESKRRPDDSMHIGIQVEIDPIQK